MEDRRDHQHEDRHAQCHPARLPAHQQEQAQAQFHRDGDGRADFRQRHTGGGDVADSACEVRQLAETGWDEKSSDQDAADESQRVLQGIGGRVERGRVQGGGRVHGISFALRGMVSRPSRTLALPPPCRSRARYAVRPPASRRRRRPTPCRSRRARRAPRAHNLCGRRPKAG
jgi:hypothetical protein